MILLYPQSESNFNNNGIGALSDAISCNITEERNGIYELEMQYPISGLHYSEIKNRSIIFVKPDPYRDPQPFRVYRITKPLSGQVTVYGQHISYDLSGIVVSPFSASSCLAALQGIETYSSTENPFTFWTDKSNTGNFSVDVPSSVRSLLGGTEGSILDVYKGEYEFDRWDVKLWNQRGQNSGVTIRYGKNLTDLQQDENISNIATGVYPYWKGSDNELVELPEKIVNAPGTYHFTKIIPLDFSGDFQDKPSEDQLRQRAEQYVEDNEIGVPAVSITVAFQPLEQTEEYKDIALLERINLCDTVTVEYPELGVSATAKCVKTVYDVLKDKYSSIELGEAKTNIADTIANQQKVIEETPTTSFMQQAITNATNIITGNKGGYVIMRDSNGDGEPDEILIMDTPSINTSQKVWRWNNGGLGYSSSGYNGPYSTAITQDGAIVANFITAGILNGNLIKTGRIQSLTPGGPYFDFSANGGKGEIASSVLKGVDDDSSCLAIIGKGSFSDGTAYEGIDVRSSYGKGGAIHMAMWRGTEDFSYSNAADLSSSGNLHIFSNSISNNPGGANVINLIGNSSGEGTISIVRGSSNKTNQLILDATSNRTILLYNNDRYLSITNDYFRIYHKNKIEFATGGYISASIESNGDAKFGNIYSNGVIVTSDRNKKENIQLYCDNAVKIISDCSVYQYYLKNSAKHQKNIGLIWDEAPEILRRGDSENHSIDLYGMTAILWKAVQELSQRIDILEVNQ